jgi:hypothetical protein
MPGNVMSASSHLIISSHHLTVTPGQHCHAERLNRDDAARAHEDVTSHVDEM